MTSVPNDSPRVETEEAAGFDPRDLRRALGSFATGVTIVTARRNDGAPVGLTVNSFSSVSLEPPLILWSLSVYAPSLPAMQEATHFAVNILAEDQTDLSNRFAKPSSDKFAGVKITEGIEGLPLIDGAVAYFQCRNESRYYGGDHVIFLGLVEDYAHGGQTPLVFCQGRYAVADFSHHESGK